MPDVEIRSGRVDARGLSRRQFIGYVIAASTLVTAAELGRAQPAAAAIPTEQPVDSFDLTDLLTDAALATASLITIAVNPDGTVSFALPRAEVGQGITTAIAMVIAEEMDLSLDKVHMTLADARPELVWNQLTGGSNSVHSLYDQVRVAAAIARGRLTAAAAEALQAPIAKLKLQNGTVVGLDGKAVTYGELSGAAAAAKTAAVLAQLKPRSEFSLVGTPQRRIDALDAVTGRKQFALDLDIPGALPTMVCRPPTINGSAVSIDNQSQVLAMPGVTDVTIIPHTQFVPGGVAVRAETFGQCIDAIRALQVEMGLRDRRWQVRRQRAAGPGRRRATDDAGRSARRWTSASRSTSVPETRSRPTARSPTCAPAAPRSGRR